MHLYILLREGDRYAFLIEALLDIFLEIEENAAEISSRASWANINVDAAVG